MTGIWKVIKLDSVQLQYFCYCKTVLSLEPEEDFAHAR